MAPSTTQLVSAGEELLTAVRLFGSGIGQLHALDDGESDFFHLPLLVLQQGLERWVKISLCYLKLEQTGEFPDKSFFPRSKQGHNVQPFLDQLVAAAYTPEFERDTHYVKQDRVFLKSKPFRGYLQALSNFGVSSRYFNLNHVLGVAIDFCPPEHAWQDVEASVLEYNDDLKQLFIKSEGSREVLVRMLAESRAILVRCGRALARLVALGALGEEARRHTGYVYKFLQLSDEELLSVKFDPFHKN